MTNIKKNSNIAILVCTLLAFLTLFPSITKAEQTISEQSLNALAPKLPPLSVQAKQNPTYISPYMRYAFNLPVKDAQSVYTQKDTFKPYDSSQLEQKLGTYWFLVSFSPVKDKSVSAAYLDIGNFLTKDSRILILPKNSTKWQLLEDVYTREKLSGVSPLDSKIEDIEAKSEITIFSNGLYDLTGLRDGGELLIYSPGMPSVWFSPTLILPAKASVTIDRRIAPFILISLVLLMLFSLWRGLREEGDARLWAALLTFFALIQYIWGIPQNADGNLRIWDMIGIISASCALFLLPHIGRHYMVTEKSSPSLDGFLQFLALPAICPIAIILMPLPEYLSIIRFAPLWGLYAFLPLIFCLPMALRGRKGALFYVFFCFCIGSGALIALAFRFNPEWYISPQVGLAFAMTAMFLAPRQTEKNIYEQTYTENTDYLSDFAENSIPMREAFFRVEAKLRDPFDQIMREACFLDFDTKSEDFTESMKILAEKKSGDLYDKHALNAIDDLTKRTDRLRNHTDSLVRACRDLSGMLGLMPQLAKKITPHQPTHELFNLKSLVLHACDGIRAKAQDKQIGLGWYIAPQMGLFYRGDKTALGLVLELLLRDSMRATEKGMISIRVRRANNPNPGHIVFTISDSGKGKPPVQRSALTLIKAWELSANYNGQVELHSSSNGLSFSFSMECIAMDAQGIKPLSFASLDDIVLLSNEFDKGRAKFANAYSSENGQSGGNIVFSKESDHDANTTTYVSGSNANGHGNTNIANSERANGLYDRVEKVNKISILLISPLAIQRQNIAWYLNRYEIWEALDVDSALAFYEKKPAMLVLVHSALTTNGYNAVLAGIRLLEDSLGISPAPFVGLYQSTTDMEFLRLAGCKHLLPANIGREDLCTAVAEIMEDPFIAPIANIDAEHTVIKKVKRNEKGQTPQEFANEQAALAVTKRLNMKRVHVGQVIDGAVDNNKYATQYNVSSSYPSHSTHEPANTRINKNEAPYPQGENFHTGMKNAHKNSGDIYNNPDFIKPAKKVQDPSQIESQQTQSKQTEPGPSMHASHTAELHAEQHYDSEQYDASQQNDAVPPHSDALEEHTSFISNILRIIRPKPGRSLQEEMSSQYADLVGEPMPMNTQTKEQDYSSQMDDQAYAQEQTHREHTLEDNDSAQLDKETDLNAEINPHVDDSHVDDSRADNFDANNLEASDTNKAPYRNDTNDILSHEAGETGSEPSETGEQIVLAEDSATNDEGSDADLTEDSLENPIENEKNISKVEDSFNTSLDENSNVNLDSHYSANVNDIAYDAINNITYGAINDTTHEDESANIENSHESIILDFAESQDTFANQKAKPHLAFLPSESEDYSPANDEDLPTISSLANTFNGNDAPSPYQDMENENVFMQSGLLNTTRDAKNELNDENNFDEGMPLPSEIEHNIQENLDIPSDILDEDYNIHTNEALLNLNLELAPLEEDKTKKRKRKKKEISQKDELSITEHEPDNSDVDDSNVDNSNLDDSNLDNSNLDNSNLDNSNLDNSNLSMTVDHNKQELSLDPVNEKNITKKNMSNKTKKVADKTMQLSFFPTSDDDSEK